MPAIGRGIELTSFLCTLRKLLRLKRVHVITCKAVSLLVQLGLSEMAASLCNLSSALLVAKLADYESSNGENQQQRGKLSSLAKILILGNFVKPVLTSTKIYLVGRGRGGHWNECSLKTDSLEAPYMQLEKSYGFMASGVGYKTLQASPDCLIDQPNRLQLMAPITVFRQFFG